MQNPLFMAFICFSETKRKLVPLWASQKSVGVIHKLLQKSEVLIGK
ncbi:MAG: hypothetical protein AB4080_13265 [Trichodesmium sp.]